jgi:cytosine/uracil/thiamine/allantoin permease
MENNNLGYFVFYVIPSLILLYIIYRIYKFLGKKNFIRLIIFLILMGVLRRMHVLNQIQKENEDKTPK